MGWISSPIPKNPKGFKGGIGDPKTKAKFTPEAKLGEKTKVHSRIVSLHGFPKKMGSGAQFPLFFKKPKKISGLINQRSQKPPKVLKFSLTFKKIFLCS